MQEGTPVLVGGADYPMALLGSGACRPGLASDVTGTSCILTLIADAPLLDPEVCNVATIEGHWGRSSCSKRAATPCAGRGAPFTRRR